MSDIRVILKQCREFVDQNLPELAQELIDWEAKGVLSEGKIRQLSEMLKEAWAFGCSAEAANMIKDAALRTVAKKRSPDFYGILCLGIKAVEDLINESNGVSGLHLNGDVAPWTELRAGGRYEEWLSAFDIAVEAVAKKGKP